MPQPIPIHMHAIMNSGIQMPINMPVLHHMQDFNSDQISKQQPMALINIGNGMFKLINLLQPEQQVQPLY